jgi:sialate O-acetylesterase
MSTNSYDNLNKYRFKTGLFLFFVFTVLSASSSFHAQEWNRVLDLRGQWKFEIGDNMDRAKPGFDDSDWEYIFVPAPWEDEGYPGYDGYAWYRKTFVISEKDYNKPFTLRLGYIDDVDEVYLNGQFISFSGLFPPNYVTGHGFERVYPIPREYLNYEGENLLAVRIYDDELHGGITDGKIGIYELKGYLIPDIDLSGNWKFRTGDDPEWKEPDFVDMNWDKIFVPAFWETQGYKDYNGFGWYRTEFKIPSNFADEKLILLVGRIDDLDETYLNGNRIGRTGRIYDNPDRMTTSNEYLELRAYFIPEEHINYRGKNVLAVRVYDQWLHGGIYSGPIGIVKQERFLQWQDIYDSEKKTIRDLFEIIFPKSAKNEE